jgi:hypothetical protein
MYKSEYYFRLALCHSKQNNEKYAMNYLSLSDKTHLKPPVKKIKNNKKKLFTRILQENKHMS